MASPLELDLNTVTFSRKESNLVISYWDREPCEPGLWLRDIFGGEKNHLYRLDLIRDGSPLDFQVKAHPHVLRLEAASGFVEFVFSKPSVLRIRGAGVTLEMSRSQNMIGGLVKAPEGCLRSILGSTKLFIRPLRGKLSWEAPWIPSPMFNSIHHRSEFVSIWLGPEAVESADAPFEFLIERYESELEKQAVATTFEEDVAAVAADFESWRAKAPKAPPQWAQTRDLAVYVNWSNVVPASGNFHAPAMLMSKIGMVRCWNWDNYFNAWAMSLIDPEFAWNQYLLHLSHQHPTGALPDGITEKTAELQYTKPPVHGWILKRMLETQQEYGVDHIGQVYQHLAAWTNWWFRYRDDDNDGVCQYNHGNDSGWDNASIFDLEMPVESPELMALLARQMDFLAQAAEQLGRPEDTVEWRNRSQQAVGDMIDHFWRDGSFVACQNDTHCLPEQGDSLLPHMAIVAGSLLPSEQQKGIVAALGEPGRFLTPYGLATEALNSPLYILKGYWRGAIWAPAMLFAIDGLFDIGEQEFGSDLAGRFCELCAQSGFAENFCSTKGEGTFDPAYTWTSSAFLICLARYNPKIPANKDAEHVLV